jgi:hypothetical protein
MRASLADQGTNGASDPPKGRAMAHIDRQPTLEKEQCGNRAEDINYRDDLADPLMLRSVFSFRTHVWDGGRVFHGVFSMLTGRS